MNLYENKVRDEKKIKAIKDHLQEIKHLLEKRAAEDKKTTTKKPHSKHSATTTKKAHQKHHESSTTTKKPDDDGGEEDGDASKEHSATAKSSDTTANPKDLIIEAEAEVAREREYWIEQEDLALSYAIAGVDSWTRAYRRLGRTHAETKLGELLYKIERKLKSVLTPSRASKLINEYIEINHPRPARFEKRRRFPSRLIDRREDDMPALTTGSGDIY